MSSKFRIVARLQANADIQPMVRPQPFQAPSRRPRLDQETDVDPARTADTPGGEPERSDCMNRLSHGAKGRAREWENEGEKRGVGEPKRNRENETGNET